ncbi:MAG: hypothetical protein JXR96_22795 [Deltaproteobacteria bacterium]|nr:hypothetical protein [Deltaproteobacteria bacterium]
MISSNRRIWVWPCVFFLLALSAPSMAGVPAVARKVPGDSAYAVIMTKPADVVAKICAFLDRFKQLNADLDMAVQGEKIKAELGENILTPEGMRNFGIDPDGSIAIYGPEFQGEPVVAVGLTDAKVFKEKIFAAMEKSGKPKPGKPKRISGAEVYEPGGGSAIVLKGKWCLVVPKTQMQAKKGNPIQAFFGQGRKLATQAWFKQAMQAVDANAHGMVLLDMGRVVKTFQTDMRTQRKFFEEQAKKAKDATWHKKHAKMLAAQERVGTDLLKKVQSLAIDWKLTDKRIESNFTLVSSKSGLRTMAMIFPAKPKLPAFHAEMAKTAVMSGWAALQVNALLDLFAPVPIGPESTVKNELDRGGAQFKQMFGLDLFKDLLGNAESAAFYLLSPDMEVLKPEMSKEEQVLRLIKLAVVVKLAKPAKAKEFLDKVETIMTAQKSQIAKEQIAGTEVRSLQPTPGAVVSWALKGDALLFGIGEGTVANLLKISQAGMWSRASKASERAGGTLDFAALTEAMASAVAKNVGGDEGTEFRMAWPMVKQVLSQFAQVELAGTLDKGRLSVRSAIVFH